MKVEIETVSEYKKINPCTDHEGRRRVKTGERYSVVVTVCEGMVSDGMWVRLQHAARFARREDAERLVARVKVASAGKWTEPLTALDLANWTWSHDPTNAFAALQSPPTAVPYNVG